MTHLKQKKKKIRYVNKLKTKITKEQLERAAKVKKLTATVAEHRTGHVNTNVLLEERNAKNVVK